MAINKLLCRCSESDVGSCGGLDIFICGTKITMEMDTNERTLSRCIARNKRFFFLTHTCFCHRNFFDGQKKKGVEYIITSIRKSNGCFAVLSFLIPTYSHANIFTCCAYRQARRNWGRGILAKIYLESHSLAAKLGDTINAFLT